MRVPKATGVSESRRGDFFPASATEAYAATAADSALCCAKRLAFLAPASSSDEWSDTCDRFQPRSY